MVAAHALSLPNKEQPVKSLTILHNWDVVPLFKLFFASPSKCRTGINEPSTEQASWGKTRGRGLLAPLRICSACNGRQ